MGHRPAAAPRRTALSERGAFIYAYISGLHSGPNPSPGVGTARSLRLAFPHARLVGVDYSSRSSGIHWPEFDSVWLLPSWTNLDLAAHSAMVSARVADGAIWISGLDLEALWLGEADLPNALVPPAQAFASIRKPADEAARRLGLSTPPTAPLTLSPNELHAFCREHGWQLWLKGPYYEAFRVNTWPELVAARRALADTWGTAGLHLQAHVGGHEESVVLAAFKGRLLGACSMVKRVLTSEGKTWAGTIGEVSQDLAGPLEKLLADLSWTGGAEIEMVRQPSGELSLLEWNPRFPAWIHGATLAGHNLPGLLAGAATGEEPEDSPQSGPDFTRVVLEIRVRTDHPLPVAPDPVAGFDQPTVASKHPSGMPLLSRRWAPSMAFWPSTPNGREEPRCGPAALDLALLADDLERHMNPDMVTPYRVFLSGATATRWSAIRDSIPDRDSIAGTPAVRLAYSIKTNPSADALALAHSSGFLAEAISQLEVRRALDAGFSSDQIILNGPGKWWPTRLETGVLRAVFCDSLTELRTLREWLSRGDPVAAVVGVRLRPPHLQSRFGIPVAPWQAFNELVREVQALPSDLNLGIHYHMAASAVGVDRWWSLSNSMLAWCAALEAATGVSIRCLDVGGGWHPDDWERHLLPRLPQLIASAGRSLAELREVFIEPGKALVQPSVALVTAVLESRNNGLGAREVVVDAALADLPESWAYPHTVLARGRNPGGGWTPLSPGDHRILGRSCMEDDILTTNVDWPSHLREGDLIVIADAGAYDTSMSYSFGRG